jgi:UPF0755 protein
MAKYLILFIFILLAPLGALGYYYLPAQGLAERKIELVREGETLRQVVERLAERRIVRFPRLFLLIVRIDGQDHTIQAGEYTLDSSMSPREILQTLLAGKVIFYRIPVPEGTSLNQIAALLEDRGLAEGSEILRISRDPDFLRETGIEAPSLEGYLFPDTYLFARGLSAQTLLKTMVRRFQAAYDAHLQDRQSACGWSLHEVVTLASIVEAETARAEERPLVASVLINRLRRGMPLQSDPTVIYGIEGFDGNLRREDLQSQHPYNTYVHRGLPPGPICNPGLESLKAVLYPAETDYLYFVSRNDGTHLFSTSLGDHRRAVQQYQRGGAGRHGHSAPRTGRR